MSTRDRLEGFDGVLGGPGDADDLEIAVAFDHSRQDRPGDHRIVDDHQPNSAAWFAALPGGPAIWRAPAPRRLAQATPTS